MSSAPAPGPFKASAKAAAEEGERIHRIRITLSSRNVKNLEKGAWPGPHHRDAFERYLQERVS
jgi:hypothetical protein